MGIDTDTRTFLKKIINTLSAVLSWMILHVMMGIYLQWGLFDTIPGWINIAYYIFFILTALLLVYVLKRIWKKPAT